MIETPARRNTRRKSQFPVETDGDSSSAAESDAVAKPATNTRRRGVPKFIEHIDETAESDFGSEPSPISATAPEFSNGNGVTRRNVSSNSPGVVTEDVNIKIEEVSETEPLLNGKHKLKVIDGWIPGTDHRVDASGHKEFGGAPGVTAMMVIFPLLMYYMWIGAFYYDGKLPMPADGESFEEFVKKMGTLVYTGAFPHLGAWVMFWTFFVFQGTLYCLAPGVWGKGKPLAHEGGKSLDYYCSAQWSWYITIICAVGLHYSGLFPLYTIIDEFGSIMSVCIISGFIISIIAYVSAIQRGAQHRMTGSFLYDFFMGAELNPRMFGVLDFKMFFEVRLPWYIMFLTTLGLCSRQYELYGYVSGEAWFLLMAHFLYANACAKGEELIITSWDMFYEKWGFMLIFWNIAGVPLTYIHCTLFLANHHPSEYQRSKPVLAVMFIGYLFVYWVWDSANSQKNRFRAMERGHLILRKSFPQVPWQTIHNPRTIPTETGDSLLADGWYGLARKVHYTCDAYFALNWGFITGFASPFPWFYPFFFVCMIIHRASRDISRCREKYGDAWTQYEKQVPYLFIPYVI